MYSRNGFVGRAAGVFFSKMHSAVEKGQASINAGKNFSQSLHPDSGMKISEPEDYLNKFYEYSSELENRLSRDCVSVDEELYYYIGSHSLKHKKLMNEKITYVIERMEYLCNYQFVVPSATPKVKIVLEKLKQSLQLSEELSIETGSKINKFVYAIDEADH